MFFVANVCVSIAVAAAVDVNQQLCQTAAPVAVGSLPLAVCTDGQTCDPDISIFHFPAV